MKGIFVSIVTMVSVAITSTAQTQTMYINSTKKACTGVAPMQCLQYRISPEEDWKLLYQPIEGFSYEEGFVYKIKVKTKKLTNPPADGSNVRYVLKKVLSKQKDTTIAMNQTNYSLEGKWIITSILKDGKLAEVSGKAWEMEFRTSEKTVGAHICNRIRGGYTIEGNKINFGPMMSTKMMCPDIEFETAFGKAIPQIDNYSFERNRLFLKRGNETLIILAMPVH